MKNQITDLIGLKIYSENGMFIGEVDDIILDIDSKRIDALAVGKLNPEVIEVKTHKGVKVPYRLVKSISDVIVIRHVPQLFRSDGDL
ncbi:PRC-barrel domain-containing protein [Methanospirillum sp. J.3.6.1-F.2.7.3]|jgi:sporulation protein YlmC with PRC-barrel domain|uniref:PRC-barrel domain-containing protein n=2 Tax=Methanospirillum TaxID=2202 RepID=A0A8E7EFZ5_9EURY|nr:MULTISPECIES: PRC-barrel domain-containing protein [Methanospirillum]MDX8551103.1 PRC-barrel domain-containing protein [Methanospirillum hungatei]NLW77352.1 photosystem reaction center subunit H [Methanomicrobiales archaeon]QVV87763.1 PRC-barrel domain-containing protein [Methanospirillum sp. J.3.6.1-F.2.7.3]QXO95317.1 PRC-barrel domain-containing protein [Methanospirillum hungatei]